jgi:cytochrome P450
MMSNLAAELRPSVEFVFDPNTPEFNFDPFPTLSYMRDNVPVYWWPQTHSWVVTRYEDVHLLLRDPRFSVELRHYENAPPELPDEQLSTHQLLARYGLFWMRAEDHVRVRRIASPLFTENAVQLLKPAVQHVVDDALSGIDTNTRFDIARDFTPRYPLQAITHILGIPRRSSRSGAPGHGKPVEEIAFLLGSLKWADGSPVDPATPSTAIAGPVGRCHCLDVSHQATEPVQLINEV